MKVVVIGGAGTIGSEGAEAIAETEGVTEVTVADINLEAAQRVAARIGKQAKAVFVDFNKRDTIDETIEGADLVLNFAGPFTFSGPPVMKAAIEAKVNYVDISDDAEAVDPLLAFSKAAADAGVTILTGIGASPGWTNLAAKHGANRLQKVSDIRIVFLSGMLEKPGYSVFGHRIWCFASDSAAFKDGKSSTLPGGSGAKTVDFPEPVGPIEVYIANHPEAVTLPRYIKGLKNLTVWGGWVPAEHNKLLMDLVRLGFGNTTPVRVGETLISPFDFARSFFTSEQFRQTDTWKAMLQKQKVLGDLLAFKVDVEGEKNGKPVRYVYKLFNNTERNKVVWLPAVIAARKVATGDIKRPGVTLPEGLDSKSIDALLDEINRGGIHWSVEEEALA